MLISQSVTAGLQPLRRIYRVCYYIPNTISVKSDAHMKKLTRKNIIFIVIVIMVILIGVASAVFLSNLNNAPVKEAEKTTKTTPNKLPAEKKADAADKLAYEGNVEGGTQALDEAIRGTTDSYEQFVYYSRKATLLLNHNDTAGALAAAQKAYELEKTADSAAFLGQILRTRGETAQALTYYKRAIELIDKTSPMANNDKAYYESVVVVLGGKV
jgi:tetratricopeptide (TPR) repeat protein